MDKKKINNACLKHYKMIKFHYPLDLRSVEEKMQSYPFVGAEGRFRA